MIKYHILTLSILLVLTQLCSCTSKPSITHTPVKLGTTGITDGWKKFTFSEATNNKLVPLELDFFLPPSFTPNYGGNLSIGSVWGTQEDFDAGNESDGFNFTKTKKGVFRIFISMTTGYDEQSDKFSGEDKMMDNMKSIGIRNISLKRKYIGGYPGWIHRGRYKGKEMYACYIATKNSTNVISILYHAPTILNGDENIMWDTLVRSIRRPLPEKTVVKGTEASSDIKSILFMATVKKPTVFEYTCLQILGPNKAKERPTIKINVTTNETSNGLISMRSTFLGSNALVIREGNSTNTISFSSPWAIPDSVVNLTIKDLKVNADIKMDGRSRNMPEVSLKEYQKNASIAFGFLSGEPIATVNSYKDFITELFSMYDITKVSATKLVAVPNKENFKKTMTLYGKPLEYNGMDIANEIMKRYSKLEIDFDNNNFHVKKLTLTGSNQLQPYLIEIKIVRK